ncbi:MAG: addiction module toxin RelE [Candidatus Ferrigenium altingense]
MKHVPSAQLHRELAGCYKIKLLKQGFRLVYMVEGDELVVLALAVGKRGDNAAYRAASKRIK